jgi:hypothetical protein
MSRKVSLALALPSCLLKDFVDFAQGKAIGQNAKTQEVSKPRACGQLCYGSCHGAILSLLRERIAESGN